MQRNVALLLFGVFLGIAATVIWKSESSPPTVQLEIVRDLEIPDKISNTVADEIRSKNFDEIRSIEDILSLPTRFMQLEAMYALAGSSDSGQVQSLLYDANRIADKIERDSALKVLFFRMTELDPKTALAIAQSSQFASHLNHQRRIWANWGKRDLDSALREAQSLVSQAKRDLAAQSLYAASGFMGNEQTDLIEAALRIRPNRSMRAQFLYELAERSPADAIAYINDTVSPMEQAEYASWIGTRLAKQDPTIALTFAPEIRNLQARARYEQTLNAAIATNNPTAVLEQLLASGENGALQMQAYGAFKALAETDLNSALDYLERFESRQSRQQLAMFIAMEYAKQDVDSAIEWARQNEPDDEPVLQLAVIQSLAASDPDRAMSMALSMSDRSTGQRVVEAVILMVGQSDPAKAIQYASQIPDSDRRRQAGQQALSQWLQVDADAAANWLLSQRDDVIVDYLASPNMLVHNNLDVSMRLLPRVPADTAGIWRMRIAHQLVNRRSIADATDFIRQFEGQEGFAQLQNAVATAVYQKDPAMGRQLASQIADSGSRDQALTQFISQSAGQDPAAAMQMLSSISNSQMRTQAAGRLAASWSARDAAAATRWISGLPAGADRDAIIMTAAGSWRDATPEQQYLITSIGDKQMRVQAKMTRITSMLRRDPGKARELMTDPDFNDEERASLERMINNANSYSFGHSIH